MSRGFVKEDDVALAGTALLERPISPHPNYVTPTGLRLMETAYQAAEQARTQWQQQSQNPQAQHALQSIERTLRYYAARLNTAILVDPLQQPKESVLFGASVLVEDAQTNTHIFQIVGEDEADAASGKVSHVSPIALSLLGRKVGDEVVWTRPAGNLTLTILTIDYQKAPSL